MVENTKKKKKIRDEAGDFGSDAKYAECPRGRREKEEEKKREGGRKKSEAITKNPLPTCFRRLPIIFFFLVSFPPLPHHWSHAVTFACESFTAWLQTYPAWGPISRL